MNGSDFVPVLWNSSAVVDTYNNGTILNETVFTPSSSILKLAADNSVKVALVLVMLGMGNTVEIPILVAHLKRPIGIAIGMLSQFVVLPAVTFGLAHALQLPPVPALGMLVIGCCPGGSTTNIFSYWTDGDVALRYFVNVRCYSFMQLCKSFQIIPK